MAKQKKNAEKDHAQRKIIPLKNPNRVECPVLRCIVKSREAFSPSPKIHEKKF